MSYNGFYNYETWLLSLHMSDYLESLEFMARDSSSIESLESAIKDFVHETMLSDLMNRSKDIFLKDVINSFLMEVNWRELAEHNYITEESSK